MGQGGFQLSRLEFGVQAGFSQGGGLHSQAQGGEIGPFEPAGHFPGDEAGMEAVGGMEPEGAAAPGQFFQDHQQVVRRPHQQGVVVEGRVRQAQAVLPVNQLRRHRPGAAAAGKPAAAAGRRSRRNPGGSPGRSGWEYRKGGPGGPGPDRAGRPNLHRSGKFAPGGETPATSSRIPAMTASPGPATTRSAPLYFRACSGHRVA